MNMDTVIISASSINVRAIFVAQRLDVRSLDSAQRLAKLPLTLRVGAAGVVVLFRYGVVVCFNLDNGEIDDFIHSLSRYSVEPYETPEWDACELKQDETGEEDIGERYICLRRFDLPRLQLIAEVLAKSVLLSHYEAAVREQFDRVEPFARQLQSSRGGPGSRALLRHIGDSLLIESKMVGRAEISEKPDLIWEFPEYERFYLMLADEYELKERQLALQGKLSLISNTAETMLDLEHTRRSLRVEWYIVILIVVDIVIGLFEKWL